MEGIVRAGESYGRTCKQHSLEQEKRHCLFLSTTTISIQVHGPELSLVHQRITGMDIQKVLVDKLFLDRTQGQVETPVELEELDILLSETRQIVECQKGIAREQGL